MNNEESIFPVAAVVLFLGTFAMQVITYEKLETTCGPAPDYYHSQSATEVTKE